MNNGGEQLSYADQESHYMLDEKRVSFPLFR